MKPGRSTGLLLLLFLTPLAVSAQEFGGGVRAGSLGFGGEAAVGLTRFLAVRGGLGFFPVELNLAYSGVDYTVKPPSTMGTIGADFYPGGKSFRLMAGFLLRRGDIELTSADLGQAGPVEIGDSEYDQAGVISGSLQTEATAPFVGIGFGRHTAPGFGVSLDLGVAFVGEPNVALRASGPISREPGIAENLQREAQTIEEDARGVLKYWPVLSLGVKIPLG